MSCPHDRVERSRRGAYYPERPHGPETIRSVAGETVTRSWTMCLDCGTRLETSTLAKGDPR